LCYDTIIETREGEGAMSANVEAMVREGINAFKAGRKDEARALLLKATELDQFNEQAWLWLSGLMDSPEDQRTCLENVLAINPNNDRAQQGLSYLTGGQPAATSTPSLFSASPPPAYGTPPVTSAPTSVEWGAPPEPAATMPVWAQTAPRGEPSPEALDDWVTNLNLPASEVSAFSFTAETSTTASPFGDFDIADDDLFADGPFGSSPAATAMDDPLTSPAPTRTPKPAATTRAEPPARRRRSSPGRSENASLLYDLDADRDNTRSGGEDGMFGYIPSEIAPTDLPGTRERVPALLMLSTVILILLNLGAAMLLMLGLLT